MSILDERKLGIPQAAAEVGRDPATVWRWITRGVDGVRLESVRLGGRTITSREAIHRFVDRLTTKETAHA